MRRIIWCGSSSWIRRKKTVRCKEGDAGVYLSYTEEGLVERERYLDVNGLMVSLSDGTAWVEYEYDAIGQVLRKLHYDEKGNLIEAGQ